MQQPNQTGQMQQAAAAPNPEQVAPSGPPMPQGQGPPMGPQQGPQGEQGGGDPRMQKAAQAYITGLLNMLYHKKTKGKVMDMLKSAPPQSSIPRTTVSITKQMENMVSQKSQLPPLQIRFAGGVAVFSELMELSMAAGLFKGKEPNDPEKQKIMMDTVKLYVQQGIKDRTIDPIELQEAVEPLLNDEQRALGQQIAQERGLPERPGVHQAMETYARQKVDAATRKKQKAGPGMFQQAQGGMR